MSKALSKLIRDVPDFPKPGIVFKDITPLLQDAKGFRAAVRALAKAAEPMQPEAFLGIESRGFLFAGALALELGHGVLIARKPGKLPYQAHRVSYDLEYGSASLELHVDAVAKGQRVVIVDDLLATGGTAQAAARLVEQQGGVVAGWLFLVELEFLHGRQRLGQAPVASVL
ncbi:MAG TPA: adenine phosphoribosyltransferase, partial [Myxococcota bacterium]|nr:adenine phosphoribosyltransferase [Myxococcota bacterium]